MKNLVISTMKDEAPFILEWVAWYRTIGFTDFLIYSNDCTDGTDLMLDRLTQLGLVRHEANDVLRRGPHKSALKYASEHSLYHESDWVFVCDVDEYLNIHHGGGRIEDLRAAYPDADVIPVVWRIFSANGETEILDGSILERLTDAAPLPDPEQGEPVGFIKTLFRREAGVERLGLHRPFFRDDAEEVWALRPPGDDDPLRLVGRLGLETAQLNHYAVRSAKSFLVKRDRGRANHTTNTIGLDYWKRWNAGGVPDRSALRHWAAHKAELDRLLADPLLATLHGAGLEMHRKRADGLLEVPDFREIYDAILEGFARDGTAKPPPPPELEEVAETVTPAEPTSLAGPEESKRIIDAILTQNETERRAPNRRALRREMLDEVMPKGGRCAEIGVWQGDFSAEILSITHPRELVLIDPWDLLAEKTDEHTHAQHASDSLMRSKYEGVTATLGRLPNCVVRKGFSADVLETYPDGYFDWVYIDGNHMYDFVLQDILISARKVRPGGVIAGDDLYWKKDDRMHVRDAVHEAMRQLGDGAEQTRRGAQFIIRLADPAR